MPGTPSRLSRLASFLARLFRGAPAPPEERPPRPSPDRLDRLRAQLTPEEQAILILRLDQQLSWREVAEALAGDGEEPREPEVRHRFQAIKEKLARAGAERDGAHPASGAAPLPFGRLAVAEVARLVGDPGARLFDVRSPEAWARGHLPGAIRTAPGDAVRDLPADRALHLVYYGQDLRDLSCHDAARAAALAGYRNVFVMPAGLDGWREAGKRVETGG